ncbi:CLUMA_CG017825, isoform A [Clunio marinus]|uniref:CLUMA_CG017825, isoform A n=1 Tax=Clunio marinus TaxID=568069 RepID=A0A1J1IX32_9DIPT|nr:CLUMA_CG017825, isoform A [Clunio marinus]
MMALRNMKAKWKCPGVIKVKKGCLYRILIIGIVLLSSLYLIDFSRSHLTELSSYTKIFQRPNFLGKDDDYSNDFEEIVDENYFVKTNGCRIVKMDVMNDQIKSFFPSENDKPTPIKCGPPPLTDSDERYLWINLTEVQLKKFYNMSSADQLQCYYTSFSRLTDYSVVRNETLTPLHFGQRSKIDSEYIQVYCENTNQSQVYTDYHNFFPKPPDEVKQPLKTEEKYNVMILGIDSVSRLNFHRMFNHSEKTIMENLGAIEMQGYNKVGDNTYPNLIAFLSGLSSDELNGACLSNASIAFDNCHFIWNDFKNKGYQTLFAEDSADLSLFNYFKNGFEKQPVDNYFRTMVHQMESETASHKIGNYKLCWGSHRPIDVLLKYAKKFAKSCGDQQFFSFFWTSSMTHDFINYPLLIDKDVSDLLTLLKDEKYLEKTVLFMLSDHGIRFGSFRQTTFQGMVEERLPFLFAVFPKTFKQKYPLAIRNFRRNSRRLTTHFDMFETLKDLSNIDGNVLSNEMLRKRASDLNEREANLPRGISLFLEIPGHRTCDAGGIESHWCTCYEKIELSNSDQRVQKAARFVVKTLNELIKGHKTCHFLYLNSIISAHMHVLNEKVFMVPPNREKVKSLRLPKGRKKIYDITVKITTKPGPRPEFESTVRLDEINDEIKLTGIISRISTYTKGCIKDSFIEKYCFCDPI